MDKKKLIKLAQSFKNNMDKETLIKLAQPAATALLAFSVLTLPFTIDIPHSTYIRGGSIDVPGCGY